MRLTSFVAVLVLSVSSPAVAQDWIEFASREDRFTCNFPGQPEVTETTYRSQFGADLPARLYSARQGQSRYTITVADFSQIERILTEKAKACPAGAETCRGGGSSTGPGYWRADVAGAIIHATWERMQRAAKVTQFLWNNVNLVGGHQLQLTNPDGSRSVAGIYMHAQRLYIIEATAPEGYPEPGMFPQSLGWLDENGYGIRYRTLYHHAFPPPPVDDRNQDGPGRIDAPDAGGRR